MNLFTKRMELIPLSVEDLGIACYDPKIILDRYGFMKSERVISEEMQAIYRIKIQHMLEEPSSSLFSTYFWMKDRVSNRFIGEVGFKGFQDSFFSVEVGYGIEKEFENCGYMTEALRFLVDWAFMQHIEGLIYIIATTSNDNKRSQRVLEKVGFIPYSKEESQTQWMIDTALFRERLKGE